MSEKRIYTVSEIMEILNISQATAYSLIKEGLFRTVRVGGQHRISKKSLTNGLIILSVANYVIHKIA